MPAKIFGWSPRKATWPGWYISVAFPTGTLKLNPAFLRLQIVERWNGKSPLVVPADANTTGAALLLPLGPAEKPAAP